MDDLEKRLQNTETALASLCAFVQTLPMPDCNREAINSMMGDYMVANTALGARFDICNKFKDPT